MTLYEKLNKVLPYLLSIRFIDTFVSIDVLLNRKWKISKRLSQEIEIIIHKSDEPNKQQVSFVGENNEDRMEFILNSIEEIIDFNLELERKNELLEYKISELKNLFQKSSLDDLSSLEFQINANELEVVDDEQSEQ